MSPLARRRDRQVSIGYSGFRICLDSLPENADHFINVFVSRYCPLSGSQFQVSEAVWPGLNHMPVLSDGLVFVAEG